MYVVIWEYQIKEKHRADFEKIYGEDGAWVELFQKGNGYAGTELLRDVQNPHRYLTIDRWTSRQAYQHFLEGYRDEYKTLDAKCNELTENETLVGKWQTKEEKTR